MFQKLTTIDLFSLSVNSVRGSESCLTLGVQYMNNMFFDSKVMVFCYIICPNSKTFLLVLLRFWVVQALERLPTWKFDLRDLEEVKKVNFPRQGWRDNQKRLAVWAYNVTKYHFSYRHDSW